MQSRGHKVKSKVRDLERTSTADMIEKSRA
jgi:hypothetical protein